MARRRSNPSGSSMGMLLLLGGAAYFAYEYFLAPQAVNTLAKAATDPSTANAAPATRIAYVTPGGTLTSTPAPYSYNAGGTSATPLTPAQAAANPAYITAAAGAAPPNGYTTVNTIDAGTVFLRNDMYAAEFAKNIQVASPVANITLASIKTDMGLQGLSPMYHGAWG